MPRYIDANDLVRAMTLQANRTTLGEIAPPQLSYSEMLEIIADAPTADVVPKSEVEALIKENERWMMEYADYRAEVNSTIKKAKSEVAREIFTDIKKAVDGLEYRAKSPRKTVELEKMTDVVNWVLHEVVPNTIAEVEKKYTEDKK